jgi:hypothetical protein
MRLESHLLFYSGLFVNLSLVCPLPTHNQCLAVDLSSSWQPGKMPTMKLPHILPLRSQVIKVHNTPQLQSTLIGPPLSLPPSLYHTIHL